MPSYNNSKPSSRRRATTQSSSRGRAGSSSNWRGQSSSAKYGSSPTRQGSYSLRSRSLSFSGRGGTFWGRVLALDFRAILVLIIALLLIIALILGVTSAIRGCSASRNKQDGTGNPIDSRIAQGVSEELTRDFATQLDLSEKISSLASNANLYEDERLLKLALDEESALDFVLAYPESEKIAEPYGLAINAGEIPTLTCWDARWGAVDYGDSALAVTGSGPTAFSMAAMGLTGNTAHTPAVIAQKAASEGYARGNSYFAASFITDYASEFGLSAHFYEPSGDNLASILDNSTLVLTEVKAATVTQGTRLDSAHWILVLPSDEDGMVRVLDPTSTLASSETWSVSSIANASNALYAVNAASGDE